ncbi:cytochrome C [Roseovarius sp. MBR-6]|jgi:cytochrome c|uniref:c-type cytochrome n=1 Tax=Roseovarius sp. MBR-6 TaxID=3156459 RepID=UPI003392ABE6
MKTFVMTSAAIMALALPAMAEGDAAAGEKTFNQCKACHMIESPTEVIVKGGKTGPNLYGVIGRTMGGVEGFKYSDGLIAKHDAGEVWTEESLAAYTTDPSEFLGSRSKMTFKLRKGAEDVAAYLATFSE